MANELLTRTPSNVGNRRVFTWASWVKVTRPSENQNALWFVTTAGNDEFNLSIQASNGTINVYDYDLAYKYQFLTDRALYDYANWFHLIIAVDTTQKATQDRFKIYINGTYYEGSWGNVNASGGQYYDTRVNDKKPHIFGANVNGTVGRYDSRCYYFDAFLIDGLQLGPEVFGYFKDGTGYRSDGYVENTTLTSGKWSPKQPSKIISRVNELGGFGVNGYYLPMNDSSNFGADFHTKPNTIIKLKGEDLPQPRNGAPTTTDSYVSQLRDDPYAANLVLALPFVSGATESGLGDYSASIKGSGTAQTPVATNGPSITSVHSNYGSAIKFVQSSSQYITYSSSTDFNLGSGDFTMECWVNYDTVVDGVNWEAIITTAYPTDGDLYIGRRGDNGNHVALLGNGSSWVEELNSSTLAKPGQWYHVAFVKNGSKLQFYVDGVCQSTVHDNTVNPSNVNNRVLIGGRPGQIADAYITDVRLYKGVAKYTGSFDVPRHYRPEGIATWRQSIDTCENNFATFNELNLSADNSIGTLNGRTFTNGNLTVTSTANNQGASANFSPNSGKWYWEFRLDNFGADNIWMGVLDEDFGGYLLPKPVDSNYWYTNDNAELILYGSGGSVYRGNSVTQSLGQLRSGDILGIAMDLDTDGNKEPRITFYKNGVGEHTSFGEMYGANDVVKGFWRPAITFGGNYIGWIVTGNFGQNPSFCGQETVGTTYTDANGIGQFKYQPPAGHLSLCSKNLPEPTVKDPGKHFKALLWTGDGKPIREISKLGFKPGLVWIKSRNTTENHSLYDLIPERGNGARPLYSNLVNYQQGASKHLKFNNDGFTLTSNNGNVDGSKYTAWCWRAGDTVETNLDGTTVSSVSVNTEAGFSVVKYHGSGVATSVGHGLGKKPSMIFIKAYQADSGTGSNWVVYHSHLGGQLYLEGLNTTAQLGVNNPSPWNNNDHNDSVFYLSSVEGNVNGSDREFVAYCWSEIEGYSKFGRYAGNGNANGPFVYCGFKPAWILIKCYDGTSGDWQIHDNVRPGYNGFGKNYSSSSNDNRVEGTFGINIDFLSNGFKLKTDDTFSNGLYYDYVYAAFAEHPFKYSNSD